MGRPTTKTDLVTSANEQFEMLFSLINTMTDAEQALTFLFEDRDRNLRDVLIHLFEWHQLLLNWINSNSSGVEKPFLPKPYNWRTYPQMNVEFWEKHQDTSYNSSIEMLKESHKIVVSLIETYSNDELFAKKHFKWTGTTSLGSYCVSATSSHYDWAMKKIKTQIKALKLKAKG